MMNGASALLRGLLLAAVAALALLGGGDHDLSPAEAGESVTEAWVARLDGPTSGDDLARDLAVDGAGNVYVVGYSENSSGAYDITTVKYGPDGNELWTRRYPGSVETHMASIDIDSLGNVYVAGTSSNGLNEDIATIKYDANGNLLWTAQFNGTANLKDWLSSLTVDSAGNVYVTGPTNLVDRPLWHTANFGVVKYDSSGTQVWAATIPNTHYARDVAVDVVGNVYVTGFYTSGVTVKLNSNGNEVWRAHFGTDMWDVALDAAGEIYVTGYTWGNARDYATARYHPDGSLAWSRIYDGGGSEVARALSVDGAGNTYVTGEADTQGRHTTIKYGPAGNQLWVANFDPPGVTTTTTPTRRAVHVDATGNVFVIGTGSGTGSDYFLIKYNPDGNEAWTASYNGPGDGDDQTQSLALDSLGNVYVTGASLGAGTGFDYATIKYTQGPAADGANGKIAFQSKRDGNWEIYSMSADGNAQTNLSNEASDDLFPAWSPDGSKIAFGSDRDGNFEVYVMNADGSAQTRLTNDPALDYAPAWSPDGSKIAFRSDRHGNPEIYVMNADGGAQTRLTNNSALDTRPAWSPDGSKITFFSDRDGNWEVYVMDADGGAQTNLTNNPAQDADPAWSPDGSKIAFDSDRDGEFDIYVMDADGGAQTNLTNHPARDVWPAWSPDGAKIAFDSDRDGNREVYVMDADGGAQTNLANHPNDDQFPDWQAITDGPPPPILIDFEAAPGPDGVLGTADDTALTEGTVIDSQFSSLGVTFSLVQGGSPFIATEGPPTVGFTNPLPDTPAVSGVNTLTDGVAPPFAETAPFEADIAADFSGPVTAVSLVLIDFRADCPAASGITASLNALDADGNLVSSDSFTATGAEPDGNLVPLQVTGGGILRVELAGTTADCGTAIDDFTFVPVGAPPDTDGDGVPDAEDACPGTAEGADVDANGCYHDLEIVFDPNVTADVINMQNVDLVADVRNLGQLPADATASMTLPPELDIVESFPEASCSVSGQTVFTCDLGTLQPGASKAIGIRAGTPCVDADLPLEVSASVEAEVDSVAENDTDIIDFTVIADQQVCRQKLVDTFRPILILGEGELCPPDPDDPAERLLGFGTGDPYDPTTIETMLAPNNTRLMDRQVKKDEDLLNRAPTAQDLWDVQDKGEGVYIDIPGLKPGGEVEKCLGYAGRYAASAGSSSASYVYIDESQVGDGLLFITYRFFYLYNDSRNQHEGDWEDIRLAFESSASCAFSSLPELVNTACEPTTVAYSQHGCRPERDWSNDNVDKDGLRPVSYVARGSHANYFAPGRHTAILAVFGCATAGIKDYAPYDPLGTFEPGPGDPALDDNRGRRFVAYDAVIVPCDTPVLRSSEFAWTIYGGHWGQDFVRPDKQGPTVNVCETP